MYIHMCVCVHVCVFVYVYVCTCMCVCVCMCVCMCVHMCVCVCVCCMYMCPPLVWSKGSRVCITKCTTWLEAYWCVVCGGGGHCAVLTKLEVFSITGAWHTHTILLCVQPLLRAFVSHVCDL